MSSVAAFLYTSLYICAAAVQIAVGNAQQFTNHNDTDGTMFQLRLLPKAPRQVGSCYELKSDSEEFNFCYPAIHVAGVAKCGTSAMYEFLVEHKGLVKAHPTNKEFCPDGSLVRYLKAFQSHLGDSGEIYVNGCIRTSKLQQIHNVLKPEAAYILTVRSMADRLWAAYNFWCDTAFDENCTIGKWTKDGMYRAPEIFHELLMSRSSPRGRPYQPSCLALGKIYTNTIRSFQASQMQPPHVLTMDALSLPGKEEHLLRLQDYLNAQLGTNITLDPAHLHRVNTGDHKGAGNIDTATPAHEDGQYKLSGYRHMLPETVAYIAGCWTECNSISALTHFNFNCSQSA
jgi:hypothetical protein